MERVLLGLITPRDEMAHHRHRLPHPQTVFRLGALLHDVGKIAPTTFSGGTTPLRSTSGASSASTR